MTISGPDIDFVSQVVRARSAIVLDRSKEYLIESRLQTLARERGDASITDLAERFEMSLTGMKKHVVVLELAGLVTTEKVGRVRTCRIGSCHLEEEMAWIAGYRQLWDARFEALDDVINELKREETARGRKNSK